MTFALLPANEAVKSGHLTFVLRIAELKLLLITCNLPMILVRHAIRFSSSNAIKHSTTKDHRAISQQQKLFMQHPSAPGSIFILPHGMRMMRALKSALRREYDRLDYQEISTPQLYHSRLWETSGHWQNYRKDMFSVIGAGADVTEGGKPADVMFGLKPMNCPAHCLVYSHVSRSYRDLPLRLADFTALHRNELTGTLTGLTRLRQFHQDDGHIFCTLDQVQTEIETTLALFHRMYRDVFKFPSYSLSVSTRPISDSGKESGKKNFIGTEQQWSKAELMLHNAVSSHSQKYPDLPEVKIDKGAGAFYGPKIDLQLTDSQGRVHQLATLQLDFQLPERFDLTYVQDDGTSARPVMIHRAVLGSLERFWAVWMEETGGKWNFWCNPRQVKVVPVNAKVAEYAHQVKNRLRGEGRFYVDVDDSDNTLSKKIRQAQVEAYNFIVVVGEKEASSNMLSVRSRQTGKSADLSATDFLAKMNELYRNFE